MTSAAKRYPAAIVATCVVPWDDEGRFIPEIFRRQVRILRDHLTEHLYIFGTAGEGYAVSDRQFGEIARIFHAETCGTGTTGMLGVISLALTTIIERISYGRELGFRHFQISLPAWGALNDGEVDRFFSETCGRFPDCSFLHYNLNRTKKLLSGNDYARLAAAHPNLVAVKVGGDDEAFLEDLLLKAPGIQFCVGEFAYARLRDRHECGLLISLASTNFGMARKFFSARGEALAPLALELRQNFAALLSAFKDGPYMDGAYDKVLYKLHDPDFPLRLLPPYRSADEGAVAACRDGLIGAWQPEAIAAHS